MVSQKNSITIILLLLVTSTAMRSSTEAFSQFDKTLDSEKLLDIALSHPEVIIWLESHDLLETQIRHYLFNLWEIILTTNSNDSKLFDVIVTIQDSTAKVISVSYMSYSQEAYEYDQESEIAKQGLEFFKNDTNYNFFVSNNYEIGSGYDHANIVSVWGRNGTNQANRLTFRADMTFNSTSTGEYSFEMIKITSDVNFGLSVLNNNDVREILDNVTEISDFILQHQEYDEYFKAILYYDNPINIHAPGYVYEFRYSPQGYFYLEYIDNEFLITYNGDYDPAEVINPIFPMFDSLIIEIDPITGDIIDLDGIFMYNNEIVNSLDLLFKDPEIRTWITKIQRFEGSLTYDKNGIYVLTINSLPTSDFARFVFNATSGFIVEKVFQRSIPAVHNAEEVYNSVIGYKDIIAFFELNEVVNHTILYDTQGTWKVNFYNPIITQNAATVFYNDSSGEISDVSISILDPQPILLIEDIIDLVLSSNFYEHYFVYPNSELVFYYNTEGYWSVFIYSSVFPENYYRILIDDETKELFSETNYYIGNSNQTSLSEANDKFNHLQIVTEFRNSYTITQESVYFYRNWVYYAESIESQLVLNYIEITLDGDLDITETVSEQKVLDSYHYQIYTNKNYLKVENTKIKEIVESHNYHLLNKMFTYLLLDILGNDYVPWTVESEEEGENDLDILIYSGVIIGVILVIILLIRYKIRR